MDPKKKKKTWKDMISSQCLACDIREFKKKNKARQWLATINVKI